MDSSFYRFEGILIAAVVALFLWLAFVLGSAVAKSDVFGACERDGFVWRYDTKWGCAVIEKGKR